MAEEIRKNTAYNENDLAKLRNMLFEESSKPFKKQNIKKLSELSEAIAELEKEENAEPLQRCDEAIYSEIEKGKSRTFKVRKLRPFIAACCILAVIVTANTISVSAWNMNIFSLLVELTDGGALIDFGSQPEEIILPTSENDPYGIIAKCEENGITADTPHYLPEGFVLTVVKNNKIEGYNYLFFRYENNKEFITISFETYSEEFATNIPSNKHNISEIEINGHLAIVSKEDNQMIVVFRSGNYIINIFTQDVDYSECDKIINSIQ